MSDTRNMGNVPSVPTQEGPSNEHSTDAGPPPPTGGGSPPGIPAPPEQRNPRLQTASGLRDFEGRRLYFANVCSTVSPHALHCIFRSYGHIRTFHYDVTLHYGYVVYMEREQALLARYGVDGLILGSRAIRVYYPPFKPRHPTRYCYNCREMGHFIQSCPYTQCNNTWDYSYPPVYNQGQPVQPDYMNYPSAPMMQHYGGYPASQYPPQTPGGQPAGAATLMYQPGGYMPYMQQPQYMVPPQIPQHPNYPNYPPIPIHPGGYPPMAYPPQQQPPPPPPQLHPNLNAMIQEQASAIIQQNISPMVQQVVSQIMQDPALSNFQHQNGPSTAYNANEEPESASVQSGSMTMQHGSYIAEEPSNSAGPMQDTNSDYLNLGKMMQSLLFDEPVKTSQEVEEPKCCPVHNTPLTKVQKPAAPPAPAVEPEPRVVEPEPQATSSPENPAEEQPIYSVDYPCQIPALPSSIYFSLPPIVVNITGPASCGPNGPPIPLAQPANFIQENERNLQEFEEVVQDDEQNYEENEENLRAQIVAQQPPPPETPKVPPGTLIIDIPPVSEDQMSDRERLRRDRLKLRAMLMDDNETPVTEVTGPLGDKKQIYNELISTMTNSCTEIEKLFSSLSSMVGNPLAKKCMDQIRNQSEGDILMLSQQLLHQIVDKEKPTEREEILKLSNDLLAFANTKLPHSPDTPARVTEICEGAVGGPNLESSRSECDSKKDESGEEGTSRRKPWKKNKKRRR